MDKPICKKTAYSSEKFAEDHIMRLAKTSVRSRIPVRSYYCGTCGFWHITSQNSKKDERIKELEEEIKKIRIEYEAEIQKLKIENNFLKIKKQNEFEKEINLDERVKKLQQTINDKNKTISRQKLDISSLVSQINAPTQIDKFNQRYSKQD